jgi:hypothetical protein
LGEQQRTKLVRQQQPVIVAIMMSIPTITHITPITRNQVVLAPCTPCARVRWSRRASVRACRAGGWGGGSTYGERDHFSMKTGSSRRMQYPGGLSSNRFTAPRPPSQIN